MQNKHHPELKPKPQTHKNQKIEFLQKKAGTIYLKIPK